MLGDQFPKTPVFRVIPADDPELCAARILQGIGRKARVGHEIESVHHAQIECSRVNIEGDLDVARLRGFIVKLAFHAGLHALRGSNQDIDLVAHASSLERLVRLGREPHRLPDFGDEFFEHESLGSQLLQCGFQAVPGRVMPGTLLKMVMKQPLDPAGSHIGTEPRLDFVKNRGGFLRIHAGANQGQDDFMLRKGFFTEVRFSNIEGLHFIKASAGGSIFV